MARKDTLKFGPKFVGNQAVQLLRPDWTWNAQAASNAR